MQSRDSLTHTCMPHTHTLNCQRPEQKLTAQPLLPTPKALCWAWEREEGKEGGLLPECRAVTCSSQVRIWRFREGSLTHSHPHGCIHCYPGGSIWQGGGGGWYMGLHSSNSTWAPGSHGSPLDSQPTSHLNVKHSAPRMAHSRCSGSPRLHHLFGPAF